MADNESDDDLLGPSDNELQFDRVDMLSYQNTAPNSGTQGPPTRSSSHTSDEQNNNKTFSTSKGNIDVATNNIIDDYDLLGPGIDNLSSAGEQIPANMLHFQPTTESNYSLEPPTNDGPNSNRSDSDYPQPDVGPPPVVKVFRDTNPSIPYNREFWEGSPKPATKNTKGFIWKKKLVYAVSLLIVLLARYLYSKGKVLKKN